MLTYNITLRCDMPSCDASQQASATVLKPSEFAVPSLHSWGSPFSGWACREGERTLCPEHKRQFDEAKLAAAAADEADFNGTAVA